MPIFDPTAETLVQNWDQTVKEPIRIKLRTANHAENSQFVNFSDQFTAMTSRVMIQTEQGEHSLPAFLLRENITYSALPLQKELDPFLDALSQTISTQQVLSDTIQQSLDSIAIPVRLKLYIVLQCPHCPDVVRTVISLALASGKIDLHIIDGSLFPETARKDAVLSAPCLILDDDFRWTGSVQAREIVEMITNRDPSQLSTGTLKNILEQGDADWIVGQMIEKGTIFEAFVTLLLHETWSVRLGAMVVVEELVETDPELAARLCPILINQFDGRDVTVQGDILYALGETGNRETKEWIQSKRSGLSNQDLIDAADDALETLESKEE